jgi:hypothetical protein
VRNTTKAHEIQIGTMADLGMWKDNIKMDLQEILIG